MDSARFLCCGLMISIALHAQAMKENSELERTQPALEDKSEDKREGPDPTKIRAIAVDKLLDSVKDATARWRDLETTYAEFLADDSAFSDFTAFLDAETGESMSAGDILPVEVETLRILYESVIKVIAIARDREEFFDSELSLASHWRRLTQIKEFQIPECTDVNNAALLNAYNMEMVFSDWKIIARGYSFVFETFISNVYQEWLTCLLSEIAELQQDPNFSGFECEASIAAEVKQIDFHLSIVFGKLEAVGAEFDDTLATFKTAIEGAGGGCYNTGRMLDAINALISVGVLRQENEAAAIATNQSYLDAGQRWFDFFLATKRGVFNNKTELFKLLKKLLDNTMFETKRPG